MSVAHKRLARLTHSQKGYNAANTVTYRNALSCSCVTEALAMCLDVLRLQNAHDKHGRYHVSAHCVLVFRGQCICICFGCLQHQHDVKQRGCSGKHPQYRARSVTDWVLYCDRPVCTATKVWHRNDCLDKTCPHPSAPSQPWRSSTVFLHTIIHAGVWLVFGPIWLGMRVPNERGPWPTPPQMVRHKYSADELELVGVRLLTNLVVLAAGRQCKEPLNQFHGSCKRGRARQVSMKSRASNPCDPWTFLY